MRTRRAIRSIASALSVALVLSTTSSRGHAQAAAGAPSGGGPSAAAPAPADVAGIASELFRSAQLVGLVVGTVDHGQQKELGFGEVQKGSGQRPDGGTIFDLGSVTTTFTATVLAALVSRGLVALDDPVEKYLPAGIAIPADRAQTITLLELATHTSGLPTARRLLAQRAAADAQHAHRGKSVFADLDGIQLVRSPGQRFMPTTLDYALLASALAHVAKVDYPALLASEVTARLGMSDTVVELGAAQLARHAQGYGTDGTPLPSPRPFPLALGANDLHSTLDDMLKFLRWNMGLTDRDRALLPILQQKRHETSRPGIDIGLSWRIKADGKHTTFLANGIRPGFHAVVAFVPESQTGVVLLTNSGVPGGLEQAAVRMVSALSGMAEVAPLPAEPSGGEDDTDEP